MTPLSTQSNLQVVKKNEIQKHKTMMQAEDPCEPPPMAGRVDGPAPGLRVLATPPDLGFWGISATCNPG